jgi:uncharacterized protein
MRQCPRRARLMALALALAVTGACFVGSPTEEDQGRPGPTPSDRAERRPDAAEFERDIRDAVGTVEQYWGERFAASGKRFVPVRQVFAYRRDGEVTCGGQEIPRNNAVYCSEGDFIAYDVNWAAAAFVKIGDAFLYFLLGHEYAHAIQIRLGVQYRFTVQQELQADCMSGAYIGDSVRARRLTLEEGDIEEFRTGLLAVGDDPSVPWFAPGAHGTAEQRASAFFSGAQNSLASCGLAP